MLRSILVFLFFTFSLVFGYEEEIKKVEAEIISEMAHIIAKNNKKIKVVTSSDLKYILKYSKILSHTLSCKKAHILVTGDERLLKKCNKPAIVTKYYLLKKYKNAIGAIYWKKGRPNVVFVKDRLEQFNIKLPDRYRKYLEREKNLW